MHNKIKEETVLNLPATILRFSEKETHLNCFTKKNQFYFY